MAGMLKLAPLGVLHLFEFLKTSKIGGIYSPYECMEWPRVQIPQARLSLLDRKGLRFTFIDKTIGDRTLNLYERKPAGHGMDF